MSGKGKQMYKEERKKKGGIRMSSKEVGKWREVDRNRRSRERERERERWDEE